jgi:STAM-binding protein
MVHPTARAHVSQAQVYEAEGNDAQTYLLLYRHADLVLQKLQTHPDKHQPQNRKALNAATTTVYSDLKKLEAIAPRIKKRHEEYQERRRIQQDTLKSLEGNGARSLSQELDGLSLQDRGSKRQSYDSRPIIDAQENHSLATRLAQREVRRRDTARRSVRQHGVSDEEEQQRRTGGSWDSWQDDLGLDDGRRDLMSQLQEVARLQQNGQSGQNDPRASYSVSHTGIAVVYVTDSCSNPRLGTLIATTIRRCRTKPSKEIHFMLAPSSVTLTQHQHDLQRNRSTDLQVCHQYHHLYHPSRQQRHET